MKRLLISAEEARLIDVNPDPAALRPMQQGSAIVVTGGRVIRVTTTPDGVIVNGKHIAVRLADPRDRRNGSGGASGSGRREIKAAMPGKVVRILIESGSEVAQGQGLLILEAMKMQNEVKAPGPGRVTSILAVQGATVASGEVLVTLE